MSDAWTEEPATPKKKSGLPAWFWWTCGTGCLVAVLVAAALGIFGYLAARKMGDPEYVKTKLVKVLPCDQWPEGYVPRGGGMMGVGVYIVEWPDPSHMMAVATLPGRSDLEKSLDPEAFQNTMPNNDLEAGELEVKGRRATTLRFKDLNGMMHLRTDISGDNAPYATVEITLPQSDQDRLEEATQKFLEPFDIWRGEG